MVLEYGIPKEKLVAGVPFYGVTKDNSKKTEAYFNFVQDGLITSPSQNEVCLLYTSPSPRDCS